MKQTLESQTPMPLLSVSKIHTPVGWLYVQFHPKKLAVSQLLFEHQQDLLAKLQIQHQTHPPKALHTAFERYFSGELGALQSLELNLEPLSTFKQQVLTTLHQAKPKRMSYSELALHAGYPGAYRATGSALKTNPIPLIIPCHRVVPKSGGMGYYMGQLHSPIKKYLLHHESLI